MLVAYPYAYSPTPMHIHLPSEPPAVLYYCAPCSLFQVAYPYAYANMPSFHGAFSRNIDATTRFNAPPSSTATGDLTGYRVVAVSV